MRSLTTGIHLPDRRAWTARVVSARATILELINREPWVGVVVAVPSMLIAVAGVMTHPYVFVPLLVLAGVALVAVEYYVDQQTAVPHRAPRAAGAPRQHSTQTRMQIKPDLRHVQAEARARATAAEADALAAETRAQASAAEAATLSAELEALANAMGGQTELSDVEARAAAARGRAQAVSEETRAAFAGAQAQAAEARMRAAQAREQADAAEAWAQAQAAEADARAAEAEAWSRAQAEAARTETRAGEVWARLSELRLGANATTDQFPRPEGV